MALYTNARGFAFVVFEGALSPYDWGVVEIRGLKKDAQITDKVRALLGRYVPDVLVMQDKPGRRTPRKPACPAQYHTRQHRTGPRHSGFRVFPSRGIQRLSIDGIRQ